MSYKWGDQYKDENIDGMNDPESENSKRLRKEREKEWAKKDAFWQGLNDRKPGKCYFHDHGLVKMRVVTVNLNKRKRQKIGEMCPICNNVILWVNHKGVMLNLSKKDNEKEENKNEKKEEL